MRPLRLLIVSPYPVLPAWSGGKIRTVALARGLAKQGHAVTVATPMGPRQTRSLARDEPFLLHPFAYPFAGAYALRDRPFPYLHLASFHPGLEAFVAPLWRDHDVVQFEHVAFARLASAVPPSIVTGYDAHNVELDYLTSECRSATIAGIVGRRTRRLEGSLVRRSDRVFTVSRHDQQRFRELHGMDDAVAVRAPNGIDGARSAGSDPSVMFRRHPGLARHGARAIYSGSDVEHNRRAVRFLLERIAPEAPEIGFIIQGGCGRRFARHCSLANVWFDHDHRTFPDYAVTGTVGLNPAVSGAGTNLKVLNYLAHGLPVVSTPFGMRGYEDLAGNVRTCATEDYLVSLRALDLPPPPSPEALVARYSWQSITATMAASYLAALDAKHGRTTDVEACPA